MFHMLIVLYVIFLYVIINPWCYYIVVKLVKYHIILMFIFFKCSSHYVNHMVYLHDLC
jgi:hypothetical protein